MTIHIRHGILVGIFLLLTVAAACPGASKTPVWVQAGEAYGLCQKMYNLSDWEKAAYAFAQFVEKYPTSQNTPVAYVQMAHCYFALGKKEEATAALDTVIKKFPASKITACVWGTKLDIAKNQGKHDEWLKLYEEIGKQFHMAPLGLPNRIDWRRVGDYWWGFSNTHFYYPRWRRTGWHINAANTNNGWVSNLLWAADTPARAQRALDILAKTFQSYGDDLPEDWKYAHVLLLRKAAETSDEKTPQAQSTTKQATARKKQKTISPEAAEKQFQEYLKAYPKNDPHVIGLWMREAEYWSGKDPQKTDKIWIDMIEAFPGYDSLGNFASKRMDFLYKKNRYADFVKTARWYLKYFPLGGWREAAIDRWEKLAIQKADKGDTSQVPVVLKVIDEEQKRYPDNPTASKRNLLRRIDLHLAAGNLKQAVKYADTLADKTYWSAETFSKLQSLANSNKEFAPVLAKARKTYKLPETKDDSPAKSLYDNLRNRIKDNQKRHMEELGEKLFSQYRNDAYTIEGIKALVDYYYSKALHKNRDKWVDLMASAYPLHPRTQDALQKQGDALYGAKEFKRAGAVYDLAFSRFPGAGKSNSWFNRRIACYTALKDVKGRDQYAQSKFGKRAAGGELHAVGKLGDVLVQGIGGYEKQGDYWANLGKKWGEKSYQGVYCYQQAYYHYYVKPTQHWHWNGVAFPAAVRTARILRTQTIRPELAWKLNFEDINVMGQGNMGAEALKTLAQRLKETPKTFRISERLDLPNFGRAVGNAKLAARGKKIFQQIFSKCRLRTDKYYLNIMLGVMYKQAGMYPIAAKAFLSAGKNISVRPIDNWGVHREAVGCLSSANSASYLGVQTKYFNQIRTAQDVSPRLLLECVNFCKSHGALPRAVPYLKKLRGMFPASAERGSAENVVRKK